MGNAVGGSVWRTEAGCPVTAGSATPIADRPVARQIRLRCVDFHAEIRSDDPSVLECLRSNFSAMLCGPGPADLVYHIEGDAGRPAGPRVDGEPSYSAREGAARLEGRNGLRITRLDSAFDAPVRDLGDLIYLLESDLVVQAQLRRPDLLFLHAAVLELGGRAYALVGRSGAGKSTTCWGLLRHGFRYLSDEMAPVAVESASVLAYPHALCMKRDPPPEYAVPQSAMRTPRGIHVALPPGAVHPTAEPLSLGAIFLVEYDPRARAPWLGPVSPGEATARLYPQVLNALAHGRDGLEAAAALARAVPAFLLRSAALGETCRAVRECVDALDPGPASDPS